MSSLPTTAPKRRRRWIPIALTAGVAFLLGLEVAARIAAHALGKERGITYDAELGWRPIANIEKRGQYWGNLRSARTNSLGWRDKEHTLEKPAGTRRILCIGDSYLFGPGVDDGERVNEDLEHELANTEAWNLAVTGYGPDQHLRALETLGKSYAPDEVVWFSPIANDLDDLRCDWRLSWPKPWYELSGDTQEELVLHRPDPNWRVRLRNASYLGEIALGFVQGAAHEQSYAPAWVDADPLKLYGAVSSRLDAVSRELGAHLLVVLIPSGGNMGAPTGDDARVVQELERRKIDHLWLADALAAAEKRGETVFLGDGHWNAAGHACVAHAVAERLR